MKNPSTLLKTDSKGVIRGKLIGTAERKIAKGKKNEFCVKLPRKTRISMMGGNLAHRTAVYSRSMRIKSTKPFSLATLEKKAISRVPLVYLSCCHLPFPSKLLAHLNGAPKG